MGYAGFPIGWRVASCDWNTIQAYCLSICHSTHWREESKRFDDIFRFIQVLVSFCPPGDLSFPMWERFFLECITSTLVSALVGKYTRDFLIIPVFILHSIPALTENWLLAPLR